MKGMGIKFCFIEGYKPKGERSARGLGTREGKSPDEFQRVTPLYCAEEGDDAGGEEEGEEVSGHLRGRFSHKSFPAESTAPSRISLQVNSRCPYYDSWSAYPRSTRYAREFR